MLRLARTLARTSINQASRMWPTGSTVGMTTRFASSSSSSSSSSSLSSSTPAHMNAADKLPQALLRVTTDWVAESASGSYVHGSNGRRYLDFTTGIGVTSLGHCHPEVVNAIATQASSIIHSQLNCYVHKPALQLVDNLRARLPEHLHSYSFANSGSEAVELSVKVARHATGRQNIVVMQGGFHGRTLATGSMTTAKTFYRAGFQPLMPGVFVTPFAYCHRCPVRTRGGAVDEETGCCGYALEQLDLLFKQQTAPEETAAIIFEPLLGEGGYVMPPESFVKGLRAKADEVGALLICDEVQSGFGRTGKLFAHEHFGVDVDILIMAKGIASGMPLSAIATSKEIMDKAWPGSIGGTYGGNAVACAAANAVLEVFDKEGILANVNARGEQLVAGLESLSFKYPIADVRGKGLMIAIEFNKDVPAGTAAAASKACQDEDLLVLTAGNYETLRLIPPLNISSDDVDIALQKMDKAFDQVFTESL